MKINNYYDKLSYKEQYRLIDRKDILKPKFPRSFFAYENRFISVISKISSYVSKTNSKITILDIGCGDGVYEKLLPRDIFDNLYKIGVDFSKKQLKKAKKYFDKTNQVDLDSDKLPINDKSIDLVICSEVLEHLFFPEKVISEISRVLKPGGVVLITVPNFPSLQTRLSILLKGSAPMVNYSTNKEHIRFYSLNDIDVLLANKFTREEVRGIGSVLFDYWNTVFKLPIPRIFQILGDRFFPKLANGIMITARKK